LIFYQILLKAQTMTQPKSRVKIGLVQMSCTDDPTNNLKKALKQAEKLADQGAQIVCFQELFTSLYFCQEEDHKNFALAESIPGPTTELCQALARKKNIVIVASLFEKRAHGVYHNTTAVIDADGTDLGKYRKMHIPDDPHYYEKFYFTPGDLGYKMFATRYGNIGVLICWDQWYPEAARLTALKGADIIFYPTAIGWLARDKKEFAETQYLSWRNVQIGHAIANGVFVASPNRVKTEDHIEFWGGSFVADPMGRLLHQASHTEEESFIVECDLSLVEQTRQGWPFLRDRRIDSYQNILKRWDDDKI